MSASDCYRLANQKLLHELENIDNNINALQHRTLTLPGIIINGVDKLSSCVIMKTKHSSPMPYIHVIYKLFLMLNIPHSWIHSITHPLPSTVNIFLVTESIKIKVYQAILEYILNTDQKSVSVKLLTA